MAKKSAKHLNFIRGGQIVMHSVRMAIQSIRYILRITIVFFLIAVVGIWYYTTTSQEKYLLFQQGKAKLIAMTDFMPNAKPQRIQIRNPKGQLITVEVNKFLKHSFVRRNFQLCQQKLISAVLYGSIASGFCLFVLT